MMTSSFLKKNPIEEKPQNKYLEKEFWKSITFRQRYDSLRSASVLSEDSSPYEKGTLIYLDKIINRFVGLEGTEVIIYNL